MNKKTLLSFGAASMLVLSLSFANVAFAQSSGEGNNQPRGWFSGIMQRIDTIFKNHSAVSAIPSKSNSDRSKFQGPGMGMENRGVVGTVSAINGTTLTVDMTHGTSTNATTTTFTVDASSAKVFKGTATTTAAVSDIVVGDKIMVKGKVDGTSVAATVITDGLMMRMATGTKPFMDERRGPNASSTRPMMNDDRGRFQGPMRDGGNRGGQPVNQ